MTKAYTASPTGIQRAEVGVLMGVALSAVLAPLEGAAAAVGATGLAALAVAYAEFCAFVTAYRIFVPPCDSGMWFIGLRDTALITK